MAYKRSMDQCIMWLKNKIAEKDSLDSVNAELCYHILIEQNSKLDRLGAQFNRIQQQLKEARSHMDQTAGENTLQGARFLI